MNFQWGPLGLFKYCHQGTCKNITLNVYNSWNVWKHLMRFSLYAQENEPYHFMYILLSSLGSLWSQGRFFYTFVVSMHWRVRSPLCGLNNLYVYETQKGKGCCHVKTSLSPPVISYWPFQCGASVGFYSSRQCKTAFCLYLTFFIHFI